MVFHKKRKFAEGGGGGDSLGGELEFLLIWGKLFSIPLYLL